MFAHSPRVLLAFLLCCCALTLTPGAFGQAGAPSDVRVDLASEQAAPDSLAAGDWAGIREAYEAGRHAVYAVDGGHQARKPGQRWQTHFDGRGFLVTPDAGGWTWGLELERYGFADREEEVTRPVRVRAEGGRVVYGWDDTLEEWYVNDRRGLEHGYTVHRRPAQDGDNGGSPLIITLAVRGPLQTEIVADGRDVRFLDDEGAAILTYTGLTVLDADARELEARFERSGARLRLLVEEQGARYPLTIDPIVQQAYLKASNTGYRDFFGVAVAISGDTVVVGAPGERSAATGVNGDQSDDSAHESGAAYVFVRSGTSWSQQAYLKGSNTEAFDRFGSSAAVAGDTVVVGARTEDSDATGVNGDQSNNNATYAGAAYVFVRSGSSWSQRAYLKASNAGIGDNFGEAVAVDGDTVVVGAPKEESSATGVNGDQSDNGKHDSGAAYVFVRNGSSWSQQAYLKASNTDAGDFFGQSVATSSGTVVVSAHGEASAATGMNGDQNDDSANQAGAAYVFERSGTTWSQQAYLKASNTDGGDLFGYSAALSGDTAVVGAGYEDSGAVGVNGDQGDDSVDGAGAAYVFVRSGANWSQQAYLKASNTDPDDVFGTSVSLSGDTVVVGAQREDSDATGVNGNEVDNSLAYAGAAYAFVRSGTSWYQAGYLKASNTGLNDSFGQAVAVSGDSIVVTAPGESSDSTGVNGDQDNNRVQWSGAAYVFELDVEPVAQFSASPTAGIEDLLVTFTDLSMGTGLSSWAWTFGDGGSSTLQHPTHTYVDPGIYSVSLTVVGMQGSDAATKTDYIAVVQDPVAEFYASPTSGEFDLPVSFTDLSTGTDLSTWYWDFGDGGASTQQDPSHVYTAYGTYTVSLTVTGAHGADTETKVDYIFVRDDSTATATPYNGSGVNPHVFTSTSLPTLGSTWTSQIDGGSLGASGMTIVVGYSASLSGLFTAYGEVLVHPLSSWQFTTFAMGASGISSHNLPIPDDPTLAGIHSYVQGFLNNVGGWAQLTNAYLLNLGY